MSEYLERLKIDLADSQKRLADVQQKMQAFQAVFQTAHADVQSYQRIIDVVSRREAIEEQQALEAQTGNVLKVLETVSAVASAAIAVGKSLESPPPPEAKATEEINKTDLIREAIRQHPGASPADLWDTVKEQVSRTYLYSVLKRLKENDEVIVRRKKYYFKAVAKPEETGDKTTVKEENSQRVN
jgi:hypothetical protein